jgi:hypothetical protein
MPTLTAPRVLLSGRHKGGHHRAHELGHEGYKEMGKKGGASSAEQSGQEAAQGDIEAEIERIKKLPEEEKKKLDERARKGEVVVPGGTGGKSLEAQLHLAEGKSDFESLKVFCIWLAIWARPERLGGAYERLVTQKASNSGALALHQYKSKASNVENDINAYAARGQKNIRSKASLVLC